MALAMTTMATVPSATIVLFTKARPIRAVRELLNSTSR